MKYTLLLSIFLSVFLGHSQSQKGTLLLRVFPSDAIVKVDGVKYVERDQNGYLTIELDSGNHVMQCWAPMHKLIEDTIYVEADSTVRKVQYIGYSDEYRAFKKNYRRQTLAKTALLVVPSALLIGFTAEYFIKEPKMKQQVETSKNEVESTRLNYINATTINTVNDHKAANERAIENYNKQIEEYNRFVTVSTIKIASSAIISGFSIWWASKFKKLEYKEQPLLSRAEFMLDPINSQAFLTWKINRP
ncbi:MAG: hypothetical protein CL840_01655 [Crocinitomicaceae bacterium]|nr:hypothetical protein [Crocinitomicaceae bacterium]|tara:strand:- start:12304 stop:13044 length:741 start_codon:yes stop_codon:yes gene_type:complete